MPLQMEAKISISNSMMIKIKSMMSRALKVSEAEPFLAKMSWQSAPRQSV